MNIHDKISAFPQQFAWKPEIEHKIDAPIEGRVAVCGMGGSALAGDIIRTLFPRSDLIVHRDFALPSPHPRAVVAISYSGNTEETLHAIKTALDKKIPLAAIASGGKLEAISHEHKIPFIKLPSGYQPREATGFMIRALLEFVDPRQEKELEALAKLNGRAGKSKGEKFAEKIFGTVPLIYTSLRLVALGYNWKIKFNETGKTPAFANVIPELFHNEMTGFDMGKRTRRLAKNFSFILLEDAEDASEIKERMRTFKKFMESKNFAVIHEKLAGNTLIERFIRSINVADWTSYSLAQKSEADPENVPWVEEFKKLNKR